MARAKDDLHLIVPQRFYTHGQNSLGDRHVYASRTRFIPDVLIDRFETVTWPLALLQSTSHHGVGRGKRLDFAARMRSMWR